MFLTHVLPINQHSLTLQFHIGRALARMPGARERPLMQEVYYKKYNHPGFIIGYFGTRSNSYNL
jgi:hypothetical protein